MFIKKKTKKTKNPNPKLNTMGRKKKQLEDSHIKNSEEKNLLMELAQQMMKCCLVEVYSFYFQYEYCSISTSGILSQFALFII